MLGLKPYHYMVYVSGFFQSGKTTFIQKLDPYATSHEKDCTELMGGDKTSTTIGFDLGKIVWIRNPDFTFETTLPLKTFEQEKDLYEGWIIRHIHLKGASGLLHFSAVRDTIINGAHGSLFLIDSADPSVVSFVKTILGETQQHFPEAPILLIANKQDKNEALSPEEVAKWVDVPEVVPLSCKSTRKNCEEIIIGLLRRIEDSRIKFSDNYLNE